MKKLSNCAGHAFLYLVHCVPSRTIHKIFWAYFWAVVWMEGCPPEKLWQCYFQWWKKLAALSMFHMSCTFFTISHSQLCLFDQEVFFISTHACKVKKNICWICSNFPSSQWLWRVRKKANQTVLLKLASFLDKYFSCTLSDKLQTTS